MKVKKIQLKGYRRFKDLTIDLGDSPKRIVALVGPNGCGKSSVLDGFLFTGNRYGNNIGNKRNKDFRYHSLDQLPNFNDNGQSVLIEFTQGSYDEVRNQKIQDNRINTIFSFRSPYRYNSALKVTQSKATDEIINNNYGATTTSDLDDKMEESYRRLNIKFTNYMNSQDCRPSEAKAKIIGDLNSSLKSCLDLEIDNLGNIEDSKGTLFFKKSDQSTPFEFDVLSSGEKEVVDILIDLYLRADEYNDTVFLIDEPELHINTAIQKKLLIEIDRLIGDNCQIWIATHSIGFLRAMQDELRDSCQVIQFTNNMELAEQKYELKPIRKTRKIWQEIFETALDDLTGLISPKTIIYCEGYDKPGLHGREKGLDAKVYNNIFSEKYNDTLFVSSGGSTELDQRSEIALAILTKVFTDIDIWLLKDRDFDAGKAVDEAKRQTYLDEHPSNHRVIKRWELENYLFDKAVLQKYCTNNDLTFNETLFDETVSNIYNDNVKDSIAKIQLACGVDNNHGNEKFKLELSELITEDMPVFAELEDCIFSRK
ncbi:MAG TPA: ATP-binding protein [Candidatus Saccharimonadaceae bacterium]|nr:ATP-binding protein [Candidatus Saccharimonadaceae bacterium]